MLFALNGAPVAVEPRAGETLLETLRVRCGVRSVKDGCQPQGQCGFCIPGIALRAHYLLSKNPAPTRGEIARAIDGHLCRCTGYKKIIDAIKLMARVRRGDPMPEPLRSGGVGARVARFQGEELVLGQRAFIDDFGLGLGLGLGHGHAGGQARVPVLHGALVLSPHPRARVLSIDTSKARIDGVVAIATAADVPGKRWYGLLQDDWPGFVAVGEETRYAGDVLAAIAAVDEATARAAAKLVAVEYEVLEPVLDPAESADVLSQTVIERGDARAALAGSAHVVRGTWRTQRIEHLFLEPESAVAEPLDGGRLRVFSGGQGVFDDRRQIAAFLGMALEDVVVEQVSSGGAFGGKEDLSVQAQTALLARLTNRPVKLTLTREESVRIHPKRHPMTMAYEAGCDADGKLTAVRARIVGDSGAYASVGAKVLERAAGHACGAYDVPCVDVEALAVTTNNPPSGAMRGFGANQTNFAMEGCIDALAKLAGLDPWEMRWRNALDVGGTFTTGQVLTKSVGLKQTLIAVRDKYDAAKRSGRAVGIACGVKNSGIGNGAKEWGRVRLHVDDDGTIALTTGFSEMGQGLLTVLTQIASEATGLPSTRFKPRVDTKHALDGGQTTGSRATLLAGRAVVDACTKLKAEVRRQKAEVGDDFCLLPSDLCLVAGREYEGSVLIDDTTPPGAEPIKTHTAFGFATQLCILDERGRVERIVAAHDVGRAINPAFCEGQIEGAVHMGLGYALTEELPCPGGVPATHKLLELGVLRATDTPPVDVILVEDPEPEGPFGAKGLGEIGLVPTAAAVAGALEAFDGIRRRTLPMKDSAAAKAMRAGKRRTC